MQGKNCTTKHCRRTTVQNHIISGNCPLTASQELHLIPLVPFALLRVHPLMRELWPVLFKQAICILGHPLQDALICS